MYLIDGLAYRIVRESNNQILIQGIVSHTEMEKLINFFYDS